MGEPFSLREAAGVTFLEVLPLQAAGPCRAVFSTRRGGVSAGPYATMNLGRGVGDDPAAVEENEGRFARASGWDPTRRARVRQVHGTAVHQADTLVSDTVPEADALITAVTSPVLTMLVADCVPVYLYDPVRQAAGLVHAGWRGTVAGAAGATLAALCRAYGTRPADVVAAIGPSIGPCCYEVDESVRAPLEQAFPRHWQALAAPAGPGHWRLDLRAANARALSAAGVAPRHIHVTAYCTSCQQELFFSHRKSGGRAGRLMAALSLLPLPGGHP